MAKEHVQTEWDAALEHDLRHLIRLTIAEDLDRQQDWTTLSLVPPSASAAARIVCRGWGTIAGLLVGDVVLDEMQADIAWSRCNEDGDQVRAGQTVAEITGSVRDILVAERTILNFIGQLSGVASHTAAFVARTTGTRAKIYDTRKTRPGWRRLQKYAVRCGGGWNHRLGLYDAMLIKDNHIAFGQQAAEEPFDAAQAVTVARQFARTSTPNPNMIVEIEVDSLTQLEQVLPAGPDIVLLDNMTTEQLQQAVGIRDQGYPHISLEASGGVNLKTVRAIAATGIDRISVGALTHSSPNFDIGLDWGA